MKYQDDIIAEVWKNRETYAARHHHNLHEIVADLQKLRDMLFVHKNVVIHVTGGADEIAAVEQRIGAFLGQLPEGIMCSQ